MMSKVRCCTLILIGCWAVASTHGCIPPGSHPSFEKKQNEQFWREAVQSKPNDAKAHWFLGAALADENRLDEAEQEFRTALKLQPDNASAHYELGNLLNMKGKRKEARAQWMEASKTRSHSLKQNAEAALRQYP